MRELKFRAWDKKDKLMYYDIETGIQFDDGSIYTFADFLESKGYHEFEIMQFTGLKDKNGTEIYEGDILKSSVDEIAGHVFYSDALFRYMLEKDSELICDLCDIDWKPEIIGNIYENKELLNEG